MLSVPRLLLNSFSTINKSFQGKRALLLFCSTRCSSRGSAFLLSEDLFKISPEVAEALAQNKPVVALESTIITHGMPFPINYRTALKVESIVRSNGAIPATIGVVEGRIGVGLKEEEVHQLSSGEGFAANGLIKISRRDLAFALANGLSGGTTVSGTMLIAHRLGIKVFATGGIGGVHRGGEVTMDVSADLTELGRTPVVVVCAGVKSILDIGRTLEYLETEGVCVATYSGQVAGRFSGDDIDFPSFFTSKSGFKAPHLISSINEAAKLMLTHQKLGLENGILIGVPILEESSVSGDKVKDAISTALIEAQESHIEGKSVTPFVLKRVSELTSGDSLKSNVALIENNAQVASQIAVEYHKLMYRESGVRFSGSLQETERKPSNKQQTDTGPETGTEANKDKNSASGRPVVVGGSILDFVVRAKTEKLTLNGSTYEGDNSISAGGVGRNVADGLSKMGHNVFFISSVGKDFNGNAILASNRGMDCSGFARLDTVPTSCVSVILNKRGECNLLVGNLEAHRFISPQHVSKYADIIKSAPLLLMDANIPLETMDFTASLCHDYGVPIWIEPTDPNLASKVMQLNPKYKEALVYASPNYEELKIMSKHVTDALDEDEDEDEEIKDTVIGVSPLEDVLHNCQLFSRKVLKHFFQTLVVTLGSQGVVLITFSSESHLGSNASHRQESALSALSEAKAESNQLKVTHFNALQVADIVNVSGAGDCLTSGTVSGILRKMSLDEALTLGLKAAALSLSSHQTVPSELTSLLR